MAIMATTAARSCHQRLSVRPACWVDRETSDIELPLSELRQDEEGLTGTLVSPIGSLLGYSRTGSCCLGRFERGVVRGGRGVALLIDPGAQEGATGAAGVEA